MTSRTVLQTSDNCCPHQFFLRAPIKTPLPSLQHLPFPSLSAQVTTTSRHIFLKAPIHCFPPHPFPLPPGLPRTTRSLLNLWSVLAAGVPDTAAVQEVIFWQGRTIQMMYHIIGQAMQKAGVQDQHPRDYLSFFCLGKHSCLLPSCLFAGFLQQRFQFCYNPV